MYRSYFEDDFRNVPYKDINQPSIVHQLFDYLPLIDEQNKQQKMASFRNKMAHKVLSVLTPNHTNRIVCS
jgi:hypothetical protein